MFCVVPTQQEGAGKEILFAATLYKALDHYIHTQKINKLLYINMIFNKDCPFYEVFCAWSADTNFLIIRCDPSRIKQYS